ncbi:nucleotide disphospho-sugar-binding domain-containing protein [Kibdelosporangium aridum]|uniref:UDP:flavonoid glycosyltransferase YjiC, YdhE family n=1 Tax=Kibdelosporangium aridum TaxID=2030 RepID=A0A1W2FUT3_KIBAR|nr:nucleotide disphospho-sugar-binding domain-containing protein [Kibdelosporangium aridum]SMD25709.1 UDP:flavonoid glycosyltransferase YjiC, YdhE family [Kibdelosporangium aridum]
MKFLFIGVGSEASVFAVAPLATAVRNAGHEVLLAVNEPQIAAAEGAGLPAVAFETESIGHFIMAGRAGNGPGGPPQGRPGGGPPGRGGPGRGGPGGGPRSMQGVGRGFARMALAGMDPLLELTKDWRPDVVVGGLVTYAAGLLATRLGVPYVRQSSDIVPTTDHDIGATEELRPELERLGLTGLPQAAMTIDVCPPSLRPSALPANTQPMRWIPGNRQRRLEPWMYTRPKDRRRVLITGGTRTLMLKTPGSSMRNLVDQLADAGAEVLIAAPEAAAKEFGAELGDVRIGWIPLDVVAPTCDVAVNHGGGATVMTLMAAGVPQLIMPESARANTVAQALADFGAAPSVEPPREGSDQNAVDVVAAGSREILANPGYAQQAQALAKEIAALPAPAEIARMMETL